MTCEELSSFLQKFAVNPETGCWDWLGAKIPNGYGVFSFRLGKRTTAHRFAYEHWVGSIPLGYQPDHLCRNRSCVNPDHLEAVSPRVNTFRGETQAALNAAKTHCPKGHPFSFENTRIKQAKTGPRRVCRTCAYEGNRIWKASSRPVMAVGA